MDKFGIIKCKTCAAPMYSDFEKGGFSCQYCGSFSSWASEPTQGRSHFAPQHVQPVMRDGAYDISHFCPSIREIDRQRKKQKHSTYGYSAKPVSEQEQVYDQEAWKKWNQRELISTRCPNCGADISGFSTQNLFECQYCGSKMGVDALLGGSLEREHIIGNPNIPAFALPFRLSKDEAKASILRLLEENPKELRQHHIPERLKDLKAVYLPYEVSDVSTLTKVDTHKGILFLFQELLNYSTALSALYTPRLVNNLGPWDFSHTVPFRPAYLNDEVQLIGMEAEDPLEIQSVRVGWLFGSAYRFLKTVDLYKEAECHWVREHVRSSFKLMLPVYFLTEDKELGIPFAVNGQTGLANALPDFYKTETLLTTKTDSGLYPLSEEITMVSPLVPVIKDLMQPELFRAAPIKQALYKHSSAELRRRMIKKAKKFFNKKEYHRNYMANREQEWAAIPKD